jgi:hypothetical protein
MKKRHILATSFILSLLLSSLLFAQYTTDLTGNGSASASDRRFSWEKPTKAFDNDSKTAWVGRIKSGNAWIKYDFGSGSEQQIEKYTFTTSILSSKTQPVDWKFKASNDGSNWTTLHEKTGASLGKVLCLS